MSGLQRGLALRVVGVVGVLISVYLLLQDLLFEYDPVCGSLAWFVCGETEALLGIPWLKYLNAAVALVAFGVVIWLAGALRAAPGESPTRARFVWGANAALGYAIILRALEWQVTGGVCVWCLALFLATLATAMLSWMEWSAARRERDASFLASDYYRTQVGLALGESAVFFVGLWLLGPLILPDTSAETVRNLELAGFDASYAEARDRARAAGEPLIVMVHQPGCKHCHRLARKLADASSRGAIGPFARAHLDHQAPIALRLKALSGSELAPQLLLLDVGGDLTLLDKRIGDLSPEELATLLDTWRRLPTDRPDA